MTTFDWTISQLDCIPQTPEGPDYVTVAHWQCTGTQDTYTGQVYSTCSFPITDSGSFTPYQNLTLNQVLGWIWANGVDKDATEAAVQSQIDNQISPSVVTPPLPWNTL